MAFSLIWRTLSLVSWNLSPISSSVISGWLMPKKHSIMFRSLSLRIDNALEISSRKDSMTNSLSANGKSWFGSISKRLLSSPSMRGASTDTWRWLFILRASSILSSGKSMLSAISSMLGRRSFSCSNLLSKRLIKRQSHNATLLCDSL